MRCTKIDSNKRKWINTFYDTIYDFYCKGNDSVYLWKLQSELKFLNYIKNAGEYTFEDADRLNSMKSLYQHILNKTY
jgi:hypothetical protein